MKRGLLICVAVLATVAAAGWTALRLEFDPSLFRRPLYGLTHQVYAWQDLGRAYPSREVAVQLRRGRDPTAEARACAHAFEIRSLSDGQQMTCHVFGDEASYQKFRAGDQSCVLAKAVQTPYASAEQAEITVHQGEPCV